MKIDYEAAARIISGLPNPYPDNIVQAKQAVDAALAKLGDLHAFVDQDACTKNCVWHDTLHKDCFVKVERGE